MRMQMQMRDERCEMRDLNEKKMRSGCLAGRDFIFLPPASLCLLSLYDSGS